MSFGTNGEPNPAASIDLGEDKVSRRLRWFEAFLTASLSLSAMLCVLWSRHWPLVGDASLIHYIAWLIERGWAPYRQLGDMNMPGSFLIELAAMHLFGAGDTGWRCYDFALLAAAAWAFFGLVQAESLSRRGRWTAWAFAAGLFAVVHLRDGLAQGGQRDLAMAVCLVGATALLLRAVARRSVRAAFGFGVLSGIAMTIKPTALPLTVVQLWLALRTLTLAAHGARGTARWRLGVAVGAGYLVGPAVALGFLWKEHAVAAFLAGLRGIVPYYASLGHRPIPYVAQHSLSPVIAVVGLWAASIAVRRPTLDWRRWTIAAGVAFGLAACLVQQRGLPYYRYPLLAFLLPLMGIDLVAALEAWATPVREGVPSGLRIRAAGVLAAAGLAAGGLFLAPQSALLVHRYRWWQMDFATTLEARLDALGGAKLSGHIQCVDSISGCGTVLYRMRLEPATGVLSDFLLFGSDEAPVVRQTRAEFAAALLRRPPRVLVVTSHLHMDGPDEYRKLDRWPAFQQFLATRYTLDTDWQPTRRMRWWSREELPAGYRVYVLRDDATQSVGFPE